MTAVPYKLAPKLEGKSRAEIADILKEEINFALSELADYKPSDYYPPEYIDINEDSLFNTTDTEDNSYEG